MYNNSPLLNSSFSSSNPFSMQQPVQSMDASIADAYKKLDQLRQQTQLYNQQMQQTQNVQKATVFTELSDELKDLSEDELNYITSSKEYQVANAKYQADFSEFLIAKFSNEFLQSGKGRSVEEMLGVVRKRKEQYKNKFADDINEIREQNKSLSDKNVELAKSNQELQEQLKSIQDQLWKE